jgi:N utilization substance protein B
MMRRSRAREVALQLLFQRDVNPDVPRREIDLFLRERLRDSESVAFSASLYQGVCDHLADIDARLTAAAENWRLPRMANVDRNILRLGAFEVLHPTPETPVPVALDEAIELAKRYGSKDSPAFVNGVLDKVRLTAEASRAPAPAE